MNYMCRENKDNVVIRRVSEGIWVGVGLGQTGLCLTLYKARPG